MSQYDELIARLRAINNPHCQHAADAIVALVERVQELEELMRDAINQAINYDGADETKLGPQHWILQFRAALLSAQPSPQPEPVLCFACEGQPIGKKDPCVVCGKSSAKPSPQPLTNEQIE